MSLSSVDTCQGPRPTLPTSGSSNLSEREEKGRGFVLQRDHNSTSQSLRAEE